MKYLVNYLRLLSYFLCSVTALYIARHNRHRMSCTVGSTEGQAFDEHSYLETLLAPVPHLARV